MTQAYFSMIRHNIYFLYTLTEENGTISSYHQILKQLSNCSIFRRSLNKYVICNLKSILFFFRLLFFFFQTKPTVSVCQNVSTMAHFPFPMTLQYQSHASGLMGSPTVPRTLRVSRLYLQLSKEKVFVRRYLKYIFGFDLLLVLIFFSFSCCSNKARLRG